MKGRISIPDFIHRVKNELVEAQGRPGDPFYELTEVTLEVSFILDASAKAGMDLWVAEIGAETKAQQTHKVTLKLVPLPRQAALEGAPAEPPVAQSAPAAPTRSNKASWSEIISSTKVEMVTLVRRSTN